MHYILDYTCLLSENPYFRIDCFNATLLITIDVDIPLHIETKMCCYLEKSNN